MKCVRNGDAYALSGHRPGASLGEFHMLTVRFLRATPGTRATPSKDSANRFATEGDYQAQKEGDRELNQLGRSA